MAEAVRHSITDPDSALLANVLAALGYPGKNGLVILNPDGSPIGTSAGGAGDPDNGTARTVVGNVAEKFKDSFGSIDVDNWDWVTGAGDALFAEGNVAASNFVAISKGIAPGFGVAVSSSCTSKGQYSIPFDVMCGVTLAVRAQGMEFSLETVGVDSNGNVIAESPVPAVAIVGTVSVTSNVATLNFNAGHNLRAGDPVVLYGNAYSPLNVGPVVLTPVNLNPNSFTVPCTAANGTYTAGGYAIRKCPCGWAKYHSGIRWVGPTAGNADAVSENGDRPMVVNWNPGNTQDVATVPNEGGINYASQPYTVALRPKGEWIIQRATEYSQYTAADQDSTTPYRSSPAPRRQNNPPQHFKYKLRFRAESFENLSQPVGAITVVSKSGSAVATVTIPNHGLTTNDFVTIYGVRDQTNFANLTTATAVASVIDANSFTISFGASFTGSSYGGFAIRVNGNQNLSPQTISAQTYAKTADGLRLVLIGSGTWTPTIGTIHTLYGLVDSTNTRLTALEGRYRVAAISTTTLELQPLDGQNLTGVSTTPANCGGTIVPNPDFRLHYAKLLSYARLMTEARRATGDRNRSQGVEVLNTPSVGANVTQLNGSTVGKATLQGGTNNGLPVLFAAPLTNADVTSAARTSTGNSGTLSDENGGGNVGALLTVTANSGTGQTLDVIAQDSYDNGTTWVDVWHFERFTTSNTTAYMPPRPFGGRRRYVWNIAGTTPSFTFKIDAMRSWGTAYPVRVQYFDRTANVLNGTASAATPAYEISGCKSVAATLTCGAVTTGGVYNLQVSNDSANWVTASADVTAVASSTVAIPMTSGTVAKYARLFVKTGGASQTGTVVSFSGAN